MIQQRPSTPSEPRILEPPAGEWLVRIRGEIIGPVPAVEVIQRMFTGEVDEKTEASVPEEGIWRTMETWRIFHPFLAQARAKLLYERQQAEIERRKRLAITRRRRKLALIAAAISLCSFALSFAIMIYRPWDISRHIQRAWAERHLPLVKLLPLAVPAARAKEVMPRVAQEDGITIDEILIDDQQPELVDIQGGGGEKKPRPAERPLDKKKVASLDSALAAKNAARHDITSPAKVHEENALTNEEIMAGVYKKKNLQGMAACVRVETKEGKELPSTIVVSFTINNDGRVGQVRIDDDNLDGSSLHRCFQQLFTKIKFREYVGERRNVDIPIKVGR